LVGCGVDALQFLVEKLMPYESVAIIIVPEKTAPKPMFIRYKKDDNFVGRDHIMREIRERFENKIPRVALTGIGGVGYVLPNSPDIKVWTY
jgi:hypothetical protein